MGEGGLYYLNLTDEKLYCKDLNLVIIQTFYIFFKFKIKKNIDLNLIDDLKFRGIKRL